MYEQVNLNISDNQKDKIQKAVKNNTPVTIRITETGKDVYALTKRQKNKLEKAFSQNKGADITLSRKQKNYNKKIEGGFLAALASMALPLLKTAVPAIAKSLGITALTGLASSGVQKLMGTGLYLKRGGCICQIESNGEGLYLGKVNGDGLQSYGDGLYLSREGNIYNGEGFLGDFVKNIPLLNRLL